MKLIQNYAKRHNPAILLYRRWPRKMTHPFICLVHAAKDGRPVLIEESSWRTVNGIMINTRRGYVIIQYRGFGT